jgi:phage shock protein A
MAQEKKLERDYTQHQQNADSWENKAMQALNSGNEDLARQALQKKAEASQMAAQFKGMWESAAKTTQNLKSQVEQLKVKLNEARMKESTLIARNETAKAQKQIAKQVGNFDTSSSFAKFDKWEQKILKNEAEAQAFTEIASDGSAQLDDQFKLLEKNSAVDDDMARLRAKLNQGG